MRTKHTMMIIAIVAAFSMAGCLETEDGVGGSETGEDGVTVLQQAVSDCGGFVESAVRSDGGDDYCAAEVLRWSYDPETGTLELVDARAVLNCCGDRSVWAEMVDGVLVVTEIDDPEPGGVRCRCMCSFDFSIVIEGVPSGLVEIELLRSGSDVDSEVVWSGVIDTTEGAGEEVINDDDATGFCGE